MDGDRPSAVAVAELVASGAVPHRRAPLAFLASVAEAAFPIIIEALADPRAIDAWFTVRLGYFRAAPRFAFVRAAIERAPSFAALADAAVAVGAMSNYACVDFDWGPLLQAAFPSGRAPGDTLDPHQRRYLEALVDNPEVWHPIGNAWKCPHPLGLDHDREAVRRLLNQP